ncbi:MAG: DNA-binding proteins Bright/BRCAA1/RBP1 and proteins containing BRIGHT domain [Caeruleum heppii]|nr:MAG: DNA-binding proteins Bright/BRCAA1/RBP1 and proteins containing BRIGHT domain [Caeruleum heppii]
MAASKTSSIAMAFAGKSASVDIPKPRDGLVFAGRDTFAAVAARSLPVKNGTAALPTPPNSISPSLPPHHFKAQPVKPDNHAPTPVQIDSDVDLHDVVEAKDQAVQPQHGFNVANHGGELAALETAGAITPSLLAKHHLPEILLAHGPLAIRHVMGYLTTSVPGFSGIPPAKARRLVVGALEGRGSGGEGGGINGDVEFEKVGWGRWDARLKGHPPRDLRPAQHQTLGDTLSPPASLPSSYSTFAANANGSRWPDRGARTRQGSTSWAGDSAVFSHDDEMDAIYPSTPEDITMLEHEADKMSLDGDDGPCSSSEEAPDEGAVMDEGLDDVTDDEDWAKIGAAALRAASLPKGRHKFPVNQIRPSVPSQHRGGRSSLLARSMPLRGPSMTHTNHTYTGFSPLLPSPNTTNNRTNSTSPFDGMASASQEREAIEALVRLSSV